MSSKYKAWLFAATITEILTCACVYFQWWPAAVYFAFETLNCMRIKERYWRGE